MIFARESYAACYPEANILGLAHWREFYGSDDFDPDVAGMAAQEREGAFVYFSARDTSGQLRGQAAFSVFYLPIFRKKTALDAFYYVMPENRAGGVMSGLLRYAAQNLRDDGVSEIFMSHHVSHDLSSIARAAGYVLSSNLYCFEGP